MARCRAFLITIVFLFKVALGYVDPCNVSTSTMKVVSQCPTTDIDLQNAVQRKNCDAIPNTCSKFEYHCLRNWNSTALVEVCAPSIYFIGGVCGEYNVDAMSVRGTSHLCRNFTPSCPDRYKSTHQFRYPGCYILESTSPNILISTGTAPTQISKETGEKKPNTESYSIGAVVGIVVAVVMGFSFIVFGIRIIYIKREKEREGKTMTWKKVISTICPCSWFKAGDSKTTERIQEEGCLIPIEEETINGQSGENQRTDLHQATSNEKSDIQQVLSYGHSNVKQNGTQKKTSNVQNTTQQTVLCEKSNKHQTMSIEERDSHQTTVKTQNALPKSMSNGENNEQKEVSYGQSEDTHHTKFNIQSDIKQATSDEQSCAQTITSNGLNDTQQGIPNETRGVHEEISTDIIGIFNGQNGTQQITSNDPCEIQHGQPGVYHSTSNIHVELAKHGRNPSPNCQGDTQQAGTQETLQSTEKRSINGQGFTQEVPSNGQSGSQKTISNEQSNKNQTTSKGQKLNTEETSSCGQTVIKEIPSNRQAWTQEMLSNEQSSTEHMTFNGQNGTQEVPSNAQGGPQNEPPFEISRTGKLSIQHEKSTGMSDIQHAFFSEPNGIQQVLCNVSSGTNLTVSGQGSLHQKTANVRTDRQTVSDRQNGPRDLTDYPQSGTQESTSNGSGDKETSMFCRLKEQHKFNEKQTIPHPKSTSIGLKSQKKHEAKPTNMQTRQPLAKTVPSQTVVERHAMKRNDCNGTTPFDEDELLGICIDEPEVDPVRILHESKDYEVNQSLLEIEDFVRLKRREHGRKGSETDIQDIKIRSLQQKVWAMEEKDRVKDKNLLFLWGKLLTTEKRVEQLERELIRKGKVLTTEKRVEQLERELIRKGKEPNHLNKCRRKGYWNLFNKRCRLKRYWNNRAAVSSTAELGEFTTN
uniref:Uncharacterized protein LOC111105609 isoform X2 n=1 Tax=Crassostrea virginica TaxID=6565 RepID=A0A8B8AWR2_CRAVI|nr:uncharacterized protein LOC111105609 isoform X2 [Crassostrea virginica]